MNGLDIQLLGELYRIWEEKQWEFPTQDDKNAAFERLCTMFNQLSPPLQKIALILTRSYSLYSFNDYQSLLIQAFKKIDDAYLKDINQIIIAPLLNPGDDNSRRSKSGHMLPYIAEHIAIPANPKLLGIKIKSFSSSEVIPEIVNSLTEEKSLIILLDDFVGSGDTAKSAVQDLQRKTNYPNDKIIVITLVAMRHAIEKLDSYSIKVICADIVIKGIAENNLIDDKSDAYSLIDGIEATLNITADQRRGYQKSEALITMIRTPDNTFPIYWCSKQLNNLDWPALFPR